MKRSHQSTTADSSDAQARFALDSAMVLRGKMRNWRSRSAVALACGALTLLAACGSTVQVTGENGTFANGLPSDPLGAVPVDGLGIPTANGSSLAPGETGAAEPSRAATEDAEAQSAAQGPGGSVQSPGAPAGSAPGVTDSTIKIGAITVDGASEFAGSLGVSFDTGNQGVMTQAMVNRINAEGGVAGRKLELVVHDIPVGDLSSNPSGAYEAACAHFTDDERVYAVTSVLGTFGDGLYSCLSKAGVIAIADDPRGASFFETYGDYFFSPAEINVTRMWRNIVPALRQAGFFDPGAKVGLLRLDTADDESAADDGLVPALEAAGLNLDEEFAFSPDNNSASQYSGAVLQFASAGITHVLTSPLTSAILFMSSAESQGYRPSYGLHSRNSPAALQVNVPTNQLRGSMVMGWQPMQDVNAARDPGPVSSRQTECTDIIKASGENTNSRTVLLVGLAICDNLFLLRDLMARSASFAPADVGAALQTLGQVNSGFTFRSGYRSGGLHDLAQGYRIASFDDGCRCFTYSSPLRTFL